jgi:hypothetical protein
MKYLLLVCFDRPAEAEPEAQAAGAEQGGADVQPWLEEMVARGVRLFGSQVCPPAQATTVRVRDGALLTTDGPYAETKEWMAGFDVIECADLDEAIGVAARHPVARRGMIEVRPFRDE